MAAWGAGSHDGVHHNDMIARIARLERLLLATSSSTSSDGGSSHSSSLADRVAALEAAASALQHRHPQLTTLLTERECSRTTP